MHVNHFIWCLTHSKCLKVGAPVAGPIFSSSGYSVADIIFYSVSPISEHLFLCVGNLLPYEAGPMPAPHSLLQRQPVAEAHCHPLP